MTKLVFNEVTGNKKFLGELSNLTPTGTKAGRDKAYILWLENPHHPSLQFKQVDREESIYSVRISLQYRALGVLRGDTIYLVLDWQARDLRSVFAVMALL